VRKSVYGKSRPEVRAKMEESLDKARKGIDPKGERQTLARFVDAWMTETQTPKLRSSTIKSYESYIRTHIAPRLGDKTLGELNAQDVQRFLNDCTRRGLSPRSVQYIRAILRAALAQALRWGYVERNVAALATPPRQQPKQIATLSATDAQRFIDTTRDDRLGALFSTALYTGMRQGELLGPRWPDVDLDSGTLRVRQAVQKIEGKWEFVEPKSANGRRTIPLCEPAIEVLRRQ
jgi:integrase